jgi:hypothetical protein
MNQMNGARGVGWWALNQYFWIEIPTFLTLPIYNILLVSFLCSNKHFVNLQNIKKFST